MTIYEFAGLRIAVQNGGAYFKQRMTEYMLPLAQEGEHSFDYGVNIRREDKLPEMTAKLSVGPQQIWKVADTEEKILWRGLLGMEEEVGVTLTFGKTEAEIAICTPDRNPMDPRDYVCTGYAVEEFCLHHRRMVMHGSCISVGGQAVLFSAPSGTGKSTHTALWKKYLPQTEYINDDTPILRLDREDAVYACGSPWSGSTELNQKIEAPLKAIVLLERGKENTIRQVGGAETFARLLGETRKYPFRDSMEAAATLCEELMERVPVYALTCDISEQAVQVVKNAIGL